MDLEAKQIAGKIRHLKHQSVESFIISLKGSIRDEEHCRNIYSGLLSQLRTQNVYLKIFQAIETIERNLSYNFEDLIHSSMLVLSDEKWTLNFVHLCHHAFKYGRKNPQSSLLNDVFVFQSLFQYFEQAKGLIRSNFSGSLQQLVAAYSDFSDAMKVYLISLNRPLSQDVLTLLASWPNSQNGFCFDHLRNQVRETLKKKLLSNQILVAEEFQIWQPFFQSLSSDEWVGSGEDSLETITQKLIKKSPETSSLLTVQLLESIPSAIPLDNFIAGSVLQAMIRLLKAETYDIKERGLDMIKYSCSRFQLSRETLLLTFNTVLDAVFGKYPGIATISLPQDHQKLTFLVGIQLFLKSCNEIALRELRMTIFSALSGYLEKEKDPGFLHFGGHLLRLNGGKQCDLAYLNVLVDGLERHISSLPLRTAYLMGLSHLLDTSDSPEVQKLYPLLEQVIKDNLKRDNIVNPDSILACALLFTASRRSGNQDLFSKILKLFSHYPNSLYNDTLRLECAKWLAHASRSSLALLRFSRVKDESMPLVLPSIFRSYVVQSLICCSLQILSNTDNNKTSDGDSVVPQPPSQFLALALMLSRYYDISGNHVVTTGFSIRSLAAVNDATLSSFSEQRPDTALIDKARAIVDFNLAILNHTVMGIDSPRLTSEIFAQVIVIACWPCLSSTKDKAVKYTKNFIRQLSFAKGFLSEHRTDITGFLIKFSQNSDCMRRKASFLGLFSLQQITLSSQGSSIVKLFAEELLTRIQQLPLFHLSAEEWKVYQDPESIIRERIEASQNPEKRSSDTEITKRALVQPKSKSGHSSDTHSWTEKVKKEKAGKQVSPEESDVLVRREVQGQVSHITQLISDCKTLLEAISSLQLYPSQLLLEAFLIILQSDKLFEFFRFDFLVAAATNTFLPLVKKTLSAEVEAMTLNIIGSWTLTNQTIPSDLPHCFSHCLDRFEHFRPSDSDYRKNWSLFLFLLPMIEKVAMEGEKDQVEKAIHVMKNSWPNDFRDSEARQVEGKRLFQPHLLPLLRVCLELVARFPSEDFEIDDFVLEVSLDLAPLRRAELDLLCSDRGLLHHTREVKQFAMELLYGIVRVGGMEILGSDAKIDAVLWMNQFTDYESINTLAVDLWTGDKQLTREAFNLVFGLLCDERDWIRLDAAKSFAAAIVKTGAVVAEQCSRLISFYIEALPAKRMETAKTPALRAKVSAPLDQSKHLRDSVAVALSGVASREDLEVDLVWQLLNFTVDYGVVDIVPEIRIRNMESALTITRIYGRREFDAVVAFFQAVLARKPADNEEVTTSDNRHAAAIILLGTVAQHITVLNTMLVTIVDMLIDSLQIPSESVQRSVSDCLLLVGSRLKGSEYGSKIMNTLMDRLVNGKTYGDRRGAAIALAALVKAYGLHCLKQYDLLTKLKESCMRGSINARQGSLFAFEFLAERLSILFEPYVSSLVDVLLASFSHSSDHVRDAASSATRVIMSKLTPHGIKRLLAPILSTLKSGANWKSRQEAMKMISMIVACAPRQVASDLPEIVSLLVRGTTDAHPKIKEASKAALQDVSSVIKNPEVAVISSTLLHALADPANRTKDALEALLELEFMHSIDPPSLALLMPILSRSLRDRVADVKRKGAAIIGNFIHMITEPSLLTPYVSALVVGLKDCLIDPIPDVRANSAKALGTLVNGLGEADISLKELLTWLFDTLKSEVSPVERSGAAQGLAEICGLCSDAGRREAMIQRVLAVRTDQRAVAREGLLWFLSFIPATLKEKTALYLDTFLPIIMDSFQDDAEAVREVSIRAGRVMISVLGLRSSIEIATLLLDGLYKDDYKIRLYSLQLLGELLVLLGDIKVGFSSFGESEEVEDEVEQLGATRILSRLRERLGKPLLDRILSSIYLIRSDFAISVRQHALQIWKGIVSNTPKTLVEVMPVLVEIIVTYLSRVEEDLRLISGRCIGELVSKLGDRVLPAIINPLQEGLQGKSTEARLGICTGLTEILSACSRKQAEDYIQVIIRTVKSAVVDESVEVSAQGARGFLVLYLLVGAIAVDQILPRPLE